MSIHSLQTLSKATSRSCLTFLGLWVALRAVVAASCEAEEAGHSLLSERPTAPPAFAFRFGGVLSRHVYNSPINHSRALDTMLKYPLSICHVPSAA